MGSAADLTRFYALLDALEAGVGGAQRLAVCKRGMNWPERGVYFFFEEGEARTGSGSGRRVVRVGTHALGCVPPSGVGAVEPEGWALCPRQAVQAPPPRTALPAHPPRPADPRHPPQDPWRRDLEGALRHPAVTGRPGAPPAAARLEALFAARPGGRMHRQGKGPPTLRVRRQGLDRHHKRPRARPPICAARQDPARQPL